MKILSSNKFLKIKRYLKKHTVKETAKEFGYSGSLISRVSMNKDYESYLKHREHINELVRAKKTGNKRAYKTSKKTVLNAPTVSDIEFMNAVKTVIKYVRSLK